MDTLPLTAVSLAKCFHIKGSEVERYYKHHLSDFKTWPQKGHATDWVLLAKNLGSSCGIDETSLCNEVYTILSNKAGHGKKGSVVAVVKGTKVEMPTRSRNMLVQSGDKWGESKQVRAKILFGQYPQLREAYSLICKVRLLHPKIPPNEQIFKLKNHRQPLSQTSDSRICTSFDGTLLLPKVPKSWKV